MSKRTIYIKKEPRTSRKNKNGIVVFENDADIFRLFTEKKTCEAERGDTSETEPYLKTDEPIQCPKDDIYLQKEHCYLEKNEGQRSNGLKYSPPKRDRNGLPILDGNGSLVKVFIEADKAALILKESGLTKEDVDFSELVATTLKGKNRDAIMREKSDTPLPKPVPLKKRLKRYPLPQDEIDLHGYTAKEAQSRTESYLRSCWKNGLFTVQIIVGRGIHSPHGAVLPDIVEDLVTRLKREGAILWFEWNKRKKSQSGALIVYLKQLT
ncbi:MAG: Smr/MutS family protein [Desulfamplus sp.]|nr:Smr/MutS family protein [Desulfamplus sp.]